MAPERWQNTIDFLLEARCLSRPVPSWARFSSPENTDSLLLVLLHGGDPYTRETA